METYKEMPWRLGEILVQNGWISWSQLEKALVIQKQTGREVEDILVDKGYLSRQQAQVLNLGEILIQNKWISWDQLQESLKEQKKSGRIIGKIFLEKGFVSESNLYQALSIQFGVPFVQFEKIQIHKEVLQLIPRAWAEELHVMPLVVERGVVMIAVSDPKEVKAQIELAQRLKKGHEVRIAIAPASEITKAIDRFYSKL